MIPTYAPPNHTTNTQTHLQALLAGQKRAEEEYGPFTQIVHEANQVFDQESQYTNKGNAVRQYLYRVIYRNEDAELAALLGFPDKQTQDANTRAYVLSLQSGVKPAIRPKFGQWEPIIREVEEQFQKCKPALRSTQMSKRIRTIAGLPRFQHLRLLELLADAPNKPEQGEKQPVEPDESTGMPALPEYAQLSPTLSKNVSPELDEIIRYAGRIAYRSYAGFYLTAALELLSAIAAGRPVLDLDGNRYTTGLYFVHIANTAMDAKSYLQRNVVERIARDVNVLSRFKSGIRHTSPEKFLANLAGMVVPENWKDFSRDEQLWKEAQLALCAQVALYFDEGGEFVEAIFQKNATLAKFADLLLQLYSAGPVFDGSDTLGRGTERIFNACITVLMSMTLPDIRQYAYAGSKLWAKGFWGRFLFVVADDLTEEEINRRFERANEIEGYTAPPETLITSLSTWDKRLGIPFCEVVEEQEEKTAGSKEKVGKTKYVIKREPLPQVFYTIDEDARDAWLSYTRALQILSLKLPEDLSGGYGRFPEAAMRIALLLASLSNTAENRIELCHWAKAQEITEVLRANLHKLYAKVAIPEESYSQKSQNKILNYLEKHPDRWIDSSELQRFCHISGPDIKPILAELKSNEMVRFDDKGGESKHKKLYRAKSGDEA